MQENKEYGEVFTRFGMGVLFTAEIIIKLLVEQ